MSGGRADNRPGLQAALRETIKHKATLVVYSRDRLARENADDADIVRRLIKAGADLESATESFDIYDENGELLGGVLAIVAQYQRRTIQKRTRNAMRKYQAEGRRMTRMDRCPYGWRPDPGDPKRGFGTRHLASAVRASPIQNEGRNRPVARILERAPHRQQCVAIFEPFGPHAYSLPVALRQVLRRILVRQDMIPDQGNGD